MSDIQNIISKEIRQTGYVMKSSVSPGLSKKHTIKLINFYKDLKNETSKKVVLRAGLTALGIGAIALTTPLWLSVIAGGSLGIAGTLGTGYAASDTLSIRERLSTLNNRLKEIREEEKASGRKK